MLYLDRMDLVETRNLLKEAAHVARYGNEFATREPSKIEADLLRLSAALVKVEDIEESMY